MRQGTTSKFAWVGHAAPFLLSDPLQYGAYDEGGGVAGKLDDLFASVGVWGGEVGGHNEVYELPVDA